MNDVKCPVCSEKNVSLLEKKETYHLDLAIFYKITHHTYVCKECWYNWIKFSRYVMHDFNDEEEMEEVLPKIEEVIDPKQIVFDRKE
ncbi:hypothetical protein ES705_11845 [subsurface metagenome]|jgi:C4-type Zn-finger protein